jgi:hypothetical protein
VIVVSSLVRVGAAARRRRRCSTTVLATVLGCFVTAPADAQMMPASPAEAPGVGATIADFVAGASQRFGIPEGWIAAVMRAESAFDPRATSPKGAMGLMQLMPGTWAALRARLGLGPDPYDPRDNILAGARYLRDLYDQFGAGGFLAAYNAGPGRYLDFVTRGRPLPVETRAYVANVSSRIDPWTAAVPSIRAPVTVPSSPPGIFVALTDTATGATTAAPPPSNDRSNASEFDPTRAAANALFVDALGESAR